MAKKPKPTEHPDKLRPDVAETAFRTMLEATGQAPKTLPPAQRTGKNEEAVARGSKGGKIGGKARADSMTPEQRTVIAKKAASGRWEKPKG
ncbi:MAG: hypothetical protein ABMA00_15770 [Gemmatimonas sp.]